jgi:hypothetical protein
VVQALEQAEGESMEPARLALAHDLHTEHAALQLIQKALSDLKENRQMMLRCTLGNTWWQGP